MSKYLFTTIEFKGRTWLVIGLNHKHQAFNVIERGRNFKALIFWDEILTTKEN